MVGWWGRGSWWWGVIRLVFIHWKTEGVTEGPSIGDRYQLPSSARSGGDEQLPRDQWGKLRI